MESLRVRLDFEHRNVMNKSQLKEGLRRSWLLLKPEMKTISDLAAYLLRAFDLHDSCPSGLILSMDGFVLPSFESTCILKDRDIVCVKRKGDAVVNTIQAGEGFDSLEVEENVEKQPVLKGVKLLSNEGFEKEHDENHASVHEYKVSRKRKASKKLQSSKRKKNKVATTVKCPVLAEVDQKDVCAEETQSIHHRVVVPKKSLKQNKLLKLPGEQDKLSALESDDRSNDIAKSAPSAKRFCQLQENSGGSVAVSCKPGESKKFPSRSARRKKAKRLWLREQVNIEKKKLLHQGQMLTKDDEQSPVKDDQKVFEEHHEPDENDDREDEVVPVVIRPGHIRFERLGKVYADQAVKKNESQMELLRWNGMTSKKKGKKWGTKKVASYKRNDHASLNQKISEKQAAGEAATGDNPVDLDKLKPYTSSPKEGDVVAYRLIELSSSWTPEVSSLRVGKISRYVPKSNRIMLVTVPEYPIDFEKITDTSLYGENGSLKISYSMLIDVRIVKHGNLGTTKTVTGEYNELFLGNRTPVSGVRVGNNNKETPSRTPTLALGNGEVDAWDEISQALNAKKAQLSQQGGWSKEETSGKSAWSYTASRSSALGPTVTNAPLRAQNGQ
ncbi:coilin-like isoform X4 [Carya illinoinensis]|uniref:coilin-like isoform X4 n=1 Tax=Carya illinoinensis TaxID=32201 RepID=UPI001C727E48|nr:coilin-like isoform X4 [Carya illinoinensis]